MRLTKLNCFVTAILMLAVCFSFSQKRINGNENLRIDFPFELKEQWSSDPPTWHAYIVLAPKHYSRANLDLLFLWYAKNHSNIDEEISIAVYTDPEQLRLYREYGGDDESTNYGDLPHKLKYRSPPWDAICWREKDKSSENGYNFWYSYAPILSDPNRHKRVVLNGRDIYAVQR